MQLDVSRKKNIVDMRILGIVPYNSAHYVYSYKCDHFYDQETIWDCKFANVSVAAMLIDFA